MKNSKLLKILTLCCFVIFISSFVAYRSGAFKEGGTDDALADKSNHSNTELSVDSPPAKKIIMHSSKSGPVFEKEEPAQVKRDSTKKPQNTSTQTMMGSSKSAGVIRPNDFKNQANQSNRANEAPQRDTLKKQQNKK